MKIDVLTLFPAMFAGPLDESIIKRAREAGRLDLERAKYWVSKGAQPSETVASFIKKATKAAAAAAAA